MTTYIFQPTSAAGQSVNWSNPSIWAGGVVPNSPDADVDFVDITQVATGNPYGFFVTVDGSFTTDTVQLRDYLLVSGSLTVVGTLTQFSTGEIDMLGGTLSAGSIVNNAYDIQGQGTVTAGSLSNNQLIIGAGLVVNATHLDNPGTLAASQGLLTVNVPAGGFANLSAGTLTGGSYRALPSGTLAIDAGSVISTDAASISLEGGIITSRDPVSGQDVALTNSLTAIAAAGSLAIVNGSYTFGALAVAGTVALSQGGRIASSQIVLSKGATIAGSGFVDAPVANDGVIKVTEAALVLNGAISGSGILEISAGTPPFSGSKYYSPGVAYTLEINAPASEDVLFDNNIGTLQLDKPSAFSGAIAASGAGDRIILQGVSTTAVTGLSYVGDATGGTLTLQEASGAITLKFLGAYTASSFAIAAGPQILSSDPPSLVITVNRSAPLANEDFNGDLHSDILWRNVAGGISTWHATGSGASNGIVQDTYDAQAATSWSAIDSFDFNGDGKSDILWRNASGGVAIWDATASGFDQSSYYNPSIPTSAAIVGAGDLNGDGKGDLLFRNNDGSISTSLSTGSDFQPNAYVHASVGTDWQVEGVADFNGDGKADILWRNVDGSVSTWNSTGPGFQENSWFQGGVDRAWHVVGLGDFNGDGKADILWHNDNGALSVWTGGASGFTEGQFNASAATNWSVAEVGDFNGDGKADILWRNTAGQISIWQSTGSGWTQNTYFDGSVGSEWTVAAHQFSL